eukprot:6192133-Amphidinium_carterae.1
MSVWLPVHWTCAFDATRGYPGEGPPFQECSQCGLSGHNRRTCPANVTRARPYPPMSSDPSDVVISQMTDPPEVCPPCDTPLAPVLGAPSEPYQVPLNPR